MIDAETGHSFPWCRYCGRQPSRQSFFTLSGKFGAGIGIDLKLVTTDEAYHDKDGSLYDATGVIVTTPPSAKTILPPNVDADSGAVFCHDSCGFPMLRVGFEDQMHEDKCNVESGQCQHYQHCSPSRFISLDTGLFQQIPYETE